MNWIFLNWNSPEISKVKVKIKVRGQGYDGGSNMAGKINGLEQKMLKENLKALYFHCIGHQLNLVCQDACTCVNKIVTLVKETPKRGWFAAIQASSAKSITVKLCSTLWILRKDCSDAFLANYNN